jgi:hypothetical protein
MKGQLRGSGRSGNTPSDGIVEFLAPWAVPNCGTRCHAGRRRADLRDQCPHPARAGGADGDRVPLLENYGARCACRRLGSTGNRPPASAAHAVRGLPSPAPAGRQCPRNYLGSGPGGPPGVPAGGITGVELGSGTGAGCTICGSTFSAGLMTPPLLSNLSLRFWFPSEVAFRFGVPPSAERDKSFSGIV